MTNRTGMIKSVFLKSIKDYGNVPYDLDVCEVVIGEEGDMSFEKSIMDEVFISFAPVTELTPLVGQLVLYNSRSELVGTKMLSVLVDLAQVSVVQTIPTSRNIKLISLNEDRAVCNLRIKDVKFGSKHPSTIALLIGAEEASSDKSTWVDLTCLDKESRKFNVKVFSSDVAPGVLMSKIEMLIGHYVSFDLISTRYGYQTDDIYEHPVPVVASPEVEIAKAVLLDYLEEDLQLKSVVNSKELIPTILNILDGEPGYHLVRMAIEMYFIDFLSDVVAGLDVKLLKRAVFCSRFYLLPHKKNWSINYLNTYLTMSSELKQDAELLTILDVTSDDMSESKHFYLMVKDMANKLINVKREGVTNEEIINSFSNAKSVFNGLC